MITPADRKVERPYHAYLLRIWQEEDQTLPQEQSWRFSLEDAHTHTRQGFRDMDSLLAYLNDLTSTHPSITYLGE